MNNRQAARTAMLLFLCVLTVWTLRCPAAPAEEGEEDRDFYLESIEAWDRSSTLADLGLSKSAPLFLAPFDDALRPETGTTEIQPGERFTVLSAAETWRMIRTEDRIGWIKTDQEHGANFDVFPADATLCRLTVNAPLTDDPLGWGRIVTYLHAGDRVIALAKLKTSLGDLSDRVLVETEAKRRTAWLFMDKTALEAVPVFQLENGTLSIADGVTRLGNSTLDWTYEEEDDLDGVNCRLPLRKGEISAGWIDTEEYLDGYDEETGTFRTRVERIRFPQSLTAIGENALAFGSFPEFRLPERLQYLASGAFYAVSFGKIIITAGCTGDVTRCFDRCDIGEFFVEEGNPLYSSRDGVLFSADGTVLLIYPDGKKDLHYDVPDGVTEIADWAFSSDLMDNPLQTISLPMGLRKIGKYAFSGCGRLHSLTVPLTVTELSENAFDGCASLERLSLPPGLEARMDMNWTEYGDFTWFNGDNGTTKVRPGSEN